MPDYFTLAELNALPNMSEARYTPERKEAAAAYVEAIIERVCGTSFVARTVTDEVHDGGGYSIVLDAPFVLSATSAEVDGEAVTDALSVRAGILRRYATGSTSPAAWASGSGNVLVTYEAGYSTEPPADLKEAALQATRYRLLATNSNSDMAARTINATTPDGSIQYAVAGQERPTGYPDVDAVIIGWRDKLKVFGFA